MAEVVKALYNCAFTVWNALMKIAMTLFTTSPKLAGSGTPYATVHTIYNAISDATVPIATVFFIIAIYKSVISAPPGQQAMRFLQDALRYCIILYIAANMWSVMGDIMDFADGITAKITATSGYTLSVSGDMETIIDDCLKLPDFELSGEWLGKFWSTIGCSLLFLIGGIVILFIMVASCVSIISSAFQRILKPLMILPFAGIAIALGAGGHEISRSLVSYIKTFFGFCISGAMMVIAVKTGVSLCTNLVSFDLSSASNIYKCILITVQMAITPIVISGLGLSGRTYNQIEDQTAIFISILSNHAKGSSDIVSIMQNTIPSLNGVLRGIAEKFVQDAENTGNVDIAFDYMKESVENRQLQTIIINLKNCMHYQANYEEVLAQMLSQVAAGLSAREDRKIILFSMKLTLVVISITAVIIVWIIGAGLGIDVKGSLTGNMAGQALLLITGLLYLMVGIKMFKTDK